MLIPEYKLQHIQLKKRAEEAGAVAPIVPYQVWCCGRIGEIFDLLPHGLSKKWMVQEYLKANFEEFTREAYREEQERFTSLIMEATK
ncbi:hypothetical protein [Iningainema tapete]|uniref:Uncharacterized protein n=1 Tax=Iningainema tapete BLCC-T55 TaxID=2748662 RepID=A0A8J6XAV8_9CYAN|nr:hypothetical protein [Iningainema tapete]MBD2771129.1 hypothetical protein [Iningainema tapete BLCC-T55]